MDKKLISIYSFLVANRVYNKGIQIAEYKSALLPYDNINNKVYSLLHSILNSQSQLKMDKSVLFFKQISLNEIDIKTMGNFIKCLNNGWPLPVNFRNLFNALQQQPSWGEKTAALFVKAIYQTHIGYANGLSFWGDVPTEIDKGDEIYLPVDAVIYFIFETLGNPCPKTFKDINDYIRAKAPNTDFEIWDDLWFWGFISQKTKNKVRVNGFNEAKYWNILHSPKDSNTIEDIKVLSNEFIKLIKI